MRAPEKTRVTILEAAQRLIGEKGFQALTLDEVAVGASVSKGGLLHHYPSKNALILGLAQHMIASHEQEIETLRQQDPHAPGAFTRAFLRAHLASMDECQICATLAAESRNIAQMLELFQEYSAACQSKIENDGLNPVTASIIRYAAEGLMSAAMWQMPMPSNYDELVRQLLELAGSGEPIVLEKEKDEVSVA
jgi:AcrR family transcriptional regulator